MADTIGGTIENVSSYLGEATGARKSALSSFRMYTFSCSYLELGPPDLVVLVKQYDRPNWPKALRPPTMKYEYYHW
jgi:hypothetical protein